MKKRIIGLCLIVLAAWACQKENIIPNESVESSVPVNMVKVASTYEKLYTYYSSETQETEYFCHGSDGNCLPEVTVRPKSIQDLLDDIIIATIAEDDALIAELFLNHALVLTEYCPIALVDGVSKGDYTVRSGNDYNGTSIKYLLFYNGVNEIEMVLPIEI